MPETDDYAVACSNCGFQLDGLGPVSATTHATSHGITRGHTVRILKNGEAVDSYVGRPVVDLDLEPPY